ncbi:MAG TPA: hypothetical protein VFV51_17180 [Vicinamibacterales bacterium]|nr:hypothetical protein [Vicinamibacterales bacterium]
MTTPNDPQFAEWSREWQSNGAAPPAAAQPIREYVRKRGNVVRSFLVADFAIGAVMLPVLVFLAVVAEQRVERAAMIALATITIGATAFGWWNWRGVIDSSAASVSEFVEISVERLRRMRLVWRFAWVVLASEVIVFTIWIRDQHSSRTATAGSELFAWTWLTGFSLAAVIGLVWFGRWLKRDAERFDALRREYSPAQTTSPSE